VTSEYVEWTVSLTQLLEKVEDPLKVKYNSGYDTKGILAELIRRIEHIEQPLDIADRATALKAELEKRLGESAEGEAAWSFSFCDKEDGHRYRRVWNPIHNEQDLANILKMARQTGKRPVFMRVSTCLPRLLLSPRRLTVLNSDMAGATVQSLVGNQSPGGPRAALYVDKQWCI
jgi:hypothetical protein